MMWTNLISLQTFCCMFRLLALEDPLEFRLFSLLGYNGCIFLWSGE